MRRLSLSNIDISDISIRLLANIADVMVIYTVFALVRWYLFRPMFVHIAYLLGAVLAGTIIVRYIEKQIPEGKRQRFTVIVAGAVISLVFALTTGLSYGAGNLVIVFIMFLVVWGRVVKITFTDFYGIFNIESFYWGIALIGISDLVIYLLKLMDRQRGMVSSCAVLYIIIAMYLLSTLKTKIFYNNSQVEKKVSFDLLATVATLVIALVFSSKEAMNAVIFLFGYVHKAVVWLVGVIAIPLGYVAVFILNKLRYIIEVFWKARDTSQGFWPDSDPSELNNPFNSAPIYSFIHVVAYIILVIAIIGVIYYIYKAMDRYLGKGKAQEYEESREFIFGFGQLRDNLPKGLGALKSIYNSAVGRLLFNIRASTKEKMRFEYRKFIKLLHARELISQEHTAANICGVINGLYPQVEEFTTSLTEMYEDIRYGVKEPSKEELNLFKEYLGKVISVVE